MQTCPMCGAKLTEGLSYCEACGADISIYDQVSDLLPALKGEGSLRSQGLHPFTGATPL
ncbi:hypothetical protein IC006_1409 [Sulfuracidifex tepidarius]|uniref:Zinc-ribbon domain-containing protein n=1 Tax=Sulfuracidifex tepidarius TaxID=1294262 RepID=A0A510E2Y3_9CREN|nr:hypothetical protein IC006_1409 [Sulfuracidifex tepidarius]BBG26862.1 hypothetical protein IC007_1384 [Sulfuracidifex tepidarius]